MMHRDEWAPPIQSIERFVRQRASGELVWSGAGLEAHVHLQHGRLVWATSSRASFPLGQELARRANVDASVLRTAIETSRRDRVPLAAALIETGMVAADVVRDVFRLQILTALTSLHMPGPPPTAFVPRERGDATYRDDLTFALEEVASATRRARKTTTVEFNKPSSPSTPHATNEDTRMANLKDTLNKILEIDGAIGACAVDSNSGMMLGSAGGGPVNLEIAAAGNTEVVRAKRKTMKALGLNDGIDDILITLGRQYHIIRPLGSNDALFIYLVLDKQRGNLAMARLQLAQAERELSL